MRASRSESGGIERRGAPPSSGRPSKSIGVETMELKGKAWKYGDDVDTDVIIPARYLNTSDPAELAKHCMEDADPDFMKKMKPGDVILADKNFGCGSSR